MAYFYGFHVGKYTIHGLFGICCFFWFTQIKIISQQGERMARRKKNNHPQFVLTSKLESARSFAPLIFFDFLGSKARQRFFSLTFGGF